MKKIIGYITIITINYLLLSLAVFAFSLISLKNGKVYDLLWIKYIQKNLYIKTGMRNVFQHSTNNCVKFDKDLIYVPKSGECEFSNAEFNTILNFDDQRRLNLIDDDIKPDEEVIAVIGDSIAMGWGVENNETYSYKLQKLTGKKVINQGVSSYGTVREIKRLKKSKYYNQISTIIIQYHLNDLGENTYMDAEKTYTEKEFNDYFNSYQDKSGSFKLLFRFYKKSLRLLFSHLNDILFPEKNIEEKQFSKDLIQLKKLIKKNFSGEDKKILIFTTVEPWERFVYNKNEKFEDFQFFELKFKNEHKFIIDDHPNKRGHQFISQKVFEYLQI
tara:strand:- start:131 stop:1120 length:990 start_codon:yes stop_codon:yes gene_type:complete